METGTRLHPVAVAGLSSSVTITLNSFLIFNLHFIDSLLFIVNSLTSVIEFSKWRVMFI